MYCLFPNMRFKTLPALVSRLFPKKESGKSRPCVLVVDFLRTNIFLPQSIYNEKMRDFILAYEGIGAYGNVTLGGLGEADYHVFGGTLNVPDPTRGFWKDVYDGAGESLEGEIGQLLSDETGFPTTASFDEIRDEVVSFPWIYGGALYWQTPMTGLRLGATGMQSRFHIQGKLRYDLLVDTGAPSGRPEYRSIVFELDDTTEIDHIATFGAEYLSDRWNLAAEYVHEKIGSESSYGWYVQAGWQVGNRLALAAYYSDARVDEDEVAALGLPDYYSWQKDLSLSLRIDLTDHWLFKVEQHVIDGVTMAQRRGLAEELSDPLQKSWGMLAAKVTFHF